MAMLCTFVYQSYTYLWLLKPHSKYLNPIIFHIRKNTGISWTHSVSPLITDRAFCRQQLKWFPVQLRLFWN